MKPSAGQLRALKKLATAGGVIYNNCAGCLLDWTDGQGRRRREACLRSTAAALKRRGYLLGQYPMYAASEYRLSPAGRKVLEEAER